MPRDRSDSSLFSDARAALLRGDAGHSLRLAQALAARKPASDEILMLLANAAIASGETAAGLHALEKLHLRHPGNAAIERSFAGLLNRHGSELRRQGNEAAAIERFERAQAVLPGHTESGYNLALAQHALGREDVALRVLDRHRRFHPDDADATLLASHWRLARDPERATRDVRALLQAPPAGSIDRVMLARLCADLGLGAEALQQLPQIESEHRVVTAIAVADALRRFGQIEPARRAAAIGYESGSPAPRSPGLRARLASLAIAPIMQSHEAIAADRAHIQSTLERIDDEWSPAYLSRCEPRLEQLAWSNFHLAYHGHNDRDLQRRHAAVLQRAAAVFAPALAERPGGSVRRRVGLLSSSWRDCTVGSYFGGWIAWLRGAGFEVHLYQLGPQRDTGTERLAAQAHVFRFHGGDLLALAQTIRDDALDLLIYPELGMDARLLPLAALHLARRQVVAWGHPVSSGFTTFDGYLTCGEMEPEEAADHYVEPLLPLPALGVDYRVPEVPPPASRAVLGLPEHAPLVLLPHSLFKLHPDDDALLATLAQRVPEARFVVFDGEHRAWRAQWLERLRPCFRAHGLVPDAHLHWIRTGSRTRFLQINRACDLMLDCRRWSGGNTSLDALHSRLPIVTCVATATMRARQSLAMLRRLGVAQALAKDSSAALVETVAELLREPEARRMLAATIESRSGDLFDRDATRDAFVAHVEALCTAA